MSSVEAAIECQRIHDKFGVPMITMFNDLTPKQYRAALAAALTAETSKIEAGCIVDEDDYSALEWYYMDAIGELIKEATELARDGRNRQTAPVDCRHDGRRNGNPGKDNLAYDFRDAERTYNNWLTANRSFEDALANHNIEQG